MAATEAAAFDSGDREEAEFLIQGAHQQHASEYCALITSGGLGVPLLSTVLLGPDAAALAAQLPVAISRDIFWLGCTRAVLDAAYTHLLPACACPAIEGCAWAKVLPAPLHLAASLLQCVDSGCTASALAPLATTIAALRHAESACASSSTREAKAATATVRQLLPLACRLHALCLAEGDQGARHPLLRATSRQALAGAWKHLLQRLPLLLAPVATAPAPPDWLAVLPPDLAQVVQATPDDSVPESQGGSKSRRRRKRKGSRVSPAPLAGTGTGLCSWPAAVAAHFASLWVLATPGSAGKALRDVGGVLGRLGCGEGGVAASRLVVWLLGRLRAEGQGQALAGLVQQLVRAGVAGTCQIALWAAVLGTLVQHDAAHQTLLAKQACAHGDSARALLLRCLVLAALWGVAHSGDGTACHHAWAALCRCLEEVEAAWGSPASLTAAQRLRTTMGPRDPPSPQLFRADAVSSALEAQGLTLRDDAPPLHAVRLAVSRLVEAGPAAGGLAQVAHECFGLLLPLPPLIPDTLVLAAPQAYAVPALSVSSGAEGDGLPVTRRQ